MGGKSPPGRHRGQGIERAEERGEEDAPSMERRSRHAPGRQEQQVIRREVERYEAVSIDDVHALENTPSPPRMLSFTSRAKFAIILTVQKFTFHGFLSPRRYIKMRV